MVTLIISAHHDDIEYGAYGYLSKLYGESEKLHCVVFTDGSITAPTEIRTYEAREAARPIKMQLYFMRQRDGMLKVNSETIGKLDEVINAVNPDTIIIPHWDDGHQDHVAASKIGRAASRNVSNVIYYELPHTGCEFKPNLFVDITNHLGAKRKALNTHESQRGKPVFSVERVEASAKAYGYMLGYEDRVFEAFQVVRWLK